MSDRVISVLLIEDEPEVAALMSAMLKKARNIQCEVVIAGQLTSGIDLLNEKKFNVILLDLSLPDSSGLETLRGVYSRAAGTPIIVLTGLDDEEIATQAVREGAQDYIVKGSTDVNGMVRSVIYAIERKRSEEALRRAHDELEEKVKERTAELRRINECLRKEIEERREKEEEVRIANSRLKEAQAQLIQAAKMEVVGGLASGVAHEVKNPLAIILQGVEYLERKIPRDDKSIVTTIGFIRNAVERADSIVRGLMDFSSIKELNISKQQISPIIEKALMLLKHQFAKYHIKVDKQIPENLPDIAMDRNKIEQVLLNLLMNAADAMPKGGTLTIKIYTKDNAQDGLALILEILDTGTGIEDDAMDHIFDPFFTTKRTKGGTGLGLSIVRSILKTHKAGIKITNRPEGGAQVTIIF
ncbi:MAG: ATP-binding protein [Candidatus Omnitrophota bacterium]